MKKERKKQVLLMKLLASMAFVLGNSFLGFGQSTSLNSVNLSVKKAEAGTYEFINKGRYQEQFSEEKLNELLIEVEKMRHKKDTVFFKITDYTVICVYPKK
jgi:hypothetical protein